MKKKVGNKSSILCKMARRRQKVSHLSRHVQLSRRRRNFHTMQLFSAVSARNAPLVKSLLEQGVRIKARDDLARTLLHVNAINGHRLITRYLIRAGCYINSVNCVGDTPLHEAISNHNLKVADELISHGADVRIKNCDGNTPLHLAVRKLSHIEIAKKIIRNGANVDSSNVNGISVFHFAVESKNVEIVRVLIAAGVNVNSKKSTVSALHLAAGINSMTIVNMLLNAGAEVDSRDINGCTPIQCAIHTGNIEMVKTFLRAGANIDHQNAIGATLLHNAIMCNNEAITLLLLDRGASVYHKTQAGDTALHWVSMLNKGSSHLTILKRLLERGSIVNEQNARGQTPFHLLVQNGDLDTVSLFMKYSTDLLMTDFDGGTALHYAVYNDDVNVLKLVLDSGVAVNQTCNNGLTALHHASRQFRLEFIFHLLSRGANVNALDNYGRTPLFFSVTEPYRNFQVHRPNIVSQRKLTLTLLVEANSDLALKYHAETEPKTILDVAIQRRDMRACNVIIERIAKIEMIRKQRFFDKKSLADMHPDVKRYYAKCHAELAAPGKTKIADTLIRYEHVLLRSVHIVAKYTRNIELVKEFETKHYRTLFPIYKSQLKAKFNTGYMLQKKMTKVATILSTVLQFADPTHECFEIIFKYMSTADVEYLIDAASMEEQQDI